MAQNPRRVGSYTQAVAAVLRAAVEEQDLTHEAVSERTGIARSTVGKILSGKRAIDLEETELLAEAVGMTVPRLMTAATKLRRES